jgi:flagellar hook-associated protein 2
MTMSINTGLVSGIDAGSLVAQLLKVEAAPQTALKSRLSLAQTTASAYRTLNTALQAITSLADTVLKPETWTSAKGTSSSPSVTVAAGAAASPGSLTFTVAQLASTASTVSADRWATTTEAAGITTLDIRTPGGAANSKGTVVLDGTESLTQIASKINADSSLGLVASTVQVGPGQFALQVSASKSGAAAGFELVANKSFTATSTGQNAVLTVGTASGTTSTYSVTSASNVFEGILPGATITVSKADTTTPVTVSVVSDPDATTSKVSALVDMVNSALGQIKTYTNNAPGSTAALRGEYAVNSISGQLLDAVGKAVGGNGSAAQIGIQLTRDGKITFDKETFAAALQKDPALAQRLVAAPAGKGPDGIAGNKDDVVADAGIAERLRAVAKAASDATTGTLTSLAKGQDSMAREIQDRIGDWDVRLAKRKVTLTRQFTAMETALSSLQNQSNWLAGQLK